MPKIDEVLKKLGVRQEPIQIPTTCTVEDCGSPVETVRVVLEITCRTGHAFMMSQETKRYGG